MPDETSSLASLPASSSRATTAPTTPSSEPAERPNLWSVLKDCIGKDLARITLPVVFNEPLSFLQRLSEDLEYHYLLDQAYHARGPDRPALVAAFVISHYAATADRPSKPFNPLLGETFEFIIPGKLALVAEQVAHHPPVSAIHAKGNGWTYRTAHEIKNKFRGNSLEVWPEGTVHICFDDGEHFVYEQAHTFVHNIILGDLWIDNVGTITIREVTKKAYLTTLKLKRSAMLFGEAKTQGEFSGKVCLNTPSGKGKALRKLCGNWKSDATIDGRLIWKALPRPPKKLTAGHHMTTWAWSLNAEGSQNLPRTDSRLRPDQRAWENGQYRLAKSEKERLEDAQRARREWECDNGVRTAPKWFQLLMDPITGKKEWVYRSEYFDAKCAGWPHDLPQLF